MDERSETTTSERSGPCCAIDKSCCGGAAEVASQEIASVKDGCTLNPSEMPERLARWQELFGQILGHEEGGGVAVFRFARTPALEAELRELVKLEEICCAHVSWDLKTFSDETHLTLKADVGALKVLVRELVSGEFGKRS